MTDVGLTVGQLAHRTGRARGEVVLVLNDEVAGGRVVEHDGMYTLVAEAFTAGTVRALAGLAPRDTRNARSSAHTRPNGSGTTESSSCPSDRLRTAYTRPREAVL